MVRVVFALVVLVVVLRAEHIGWGAASRGARNTCQYLATDDDMQQLDLLDQCSDYCTKVFGSKPDAVHVNADDSDYKCCSEAEPEDVYYGDLVPQGSTVVLINSTYNCTVDNSTKTWTVDTTFQDTYKQSTKTVVHFQEEITYTVKCPGIFEMTFDESYSFKSTEKTTDTSTSDVEYEDQTTVDTQKGCSYDYVMTTNQQQYATNWYVPICLTGYARCQYGSPVSDPNDPSAGSHYYWYINLLDFATRQSARCFDQKGDLSSVIADISAQSSVTETCNDTARVLSMKRLLSGE